MAEIKGEEYSVRYDAETATVHCQGTMRMRHHAYKPIMQLLDKVVADELPQITLDLRELDAPNSSGVKMLKSFVINVKKKKTSQLLLQCNEQMTWQKNSVDDFLIFMPTLQIEWE
jgi:hypothetical protein